MSSWDRVQSAAVETTETSARLNALYSGSPLAALLTLSVPIAFGWYLYLKYYCSFVRTRLRRLRTGARRFSARSPCWWK